MQISTLDSSFDAESNNIKVLVSTMIKKKKRQIVVLKIRRIALITLASDWQNFSSEVQIRLLLQDSITDLLKWRFVARLHCKVKKGFVTSKMKGATARQTPQQM